jgi:hypothetical protein
MQPVLTILEVERTIGNLGFSFLELPSTGETPNRMTTLYIRDMAGHTQKVLILPADVVKGQF